MAFSITLHDPVPVPLWLGAVNHSPGAPDVKAIYRGEYPARIVGGLHRGGFRYRVAGDADRSIRRLDLSRDTNYLDYLLTTAPGLELYDIGPLVVLRPPTTQPIRALGTLARGLRAAGTRVWADFDDNDFVLPLVEPGTLGCRMGLYPGISAEQWRAFEDQARDAARAMLEHLLPAVDGVIVATPGLVEVVAPFTSSPIVVIEPPIDAALFPAPAPRGHDVIRIGHAGLWQHAPDLAPIWPALRAVAQLPQVEVHLFGYHPHLTTQTAGMAGWYTAGGLRYYAHDELGFVDYYAAIAALDVAVLPLRDTVRNRGSGSARWCELAMAGTALVVSDLPMTAGLIDGVSALKVPPGGDFGPPLRRLIADGELRRRLGEAARAEVLAYRTLEAQAQVWHAWLNDALALPAAGRGCGRS